MIVNRQRLLELAPIKNMLSDKQRHNGVSHGLAEAGYDIRIKQDIEFIPHDPDSYGCEIYIDGQHSHSGRFTIASAIEEFDMPSCLVGIVHDKSTWARTGLSVFNTVIEPGWKGFLTLELVYHGRQTLRIPAGTGIAQVLFHMIHEDAAYGGKYQNQDDRPVAAIFAD